METLRSNVATDQPPLDAPLPWLHEHWQRLHDSHAAGRLAHALLLVGPRGVGKRHLAELLARALLCATPKPDGVACGCCEDCRLLAAGSHPDLLRVMAPPESKSGEIPVAAIRAFGEQISLTPSRAARKVALIDPADRLHPAAANALLKTLEEPPGAALMLLIAEQVARLPMTVRSRCLWLRLRVPKPQLACAWVGEHGRAAGQALTDEDCLLHVRLAHGAPLRALADLDPQLLASRRALFADLLAIAERREDPLTAAARWHSLAFEQVCDWLAGWLCDLLRLSAGANADRLIHVDQQSVLLRLAPVVRPAAGHRLLKRVLTGLGSSQVNLNRQLLLEALFLDWLGVVGAAGRCQPSVET